MTKKQITLEHLLYLIIFALALFVRLLMLGKAPLGGFEATWAYQAWELAQGQTSHIGLQAGYLTLTEGLFSLWESTNALARFWPALVGSLLILAPFLFRDKLGREAALIMALGIALDPGLVAASRLAGGPMLAVAFTLLACGLLWAGKPAWAVFFGGMALLSGPSLWMGLLGIALTLGMGRLVGVSAPPSVRGWVSPWGKASPPWGKASPWGVVSALGAVILLATSFLQHYQGLSAWMSALPAFVGGVKQPSLVPAGRLAAALLVYQPLALIFGLAAGLRGLVKGEKAATVLSIWFVAALGLALLYPGRQVYDLAWSLVPLWGLAGMGLARSLGAVKGSWVTRLQAGFIFVMFALAWLSFVGLVSAGGGEKGEWLQWGIMGATLLLAALVTAIVTGEWSWVVACKGLVSGISAALGVYVLAVMVGTAYLRPGSSRELWVPGSGGEQTGLLQESLGDFGLLETGRQENLEIVVLDENAAFPWALRGFSEVRFRETAPLDTLPLVMISGEVDASQPWTAAYRGQDFVLQTSPAWDGEAIPADWKRWVAFREAPIKEEKYILWVRGDLFPSVAEEEAKSDEPPLEEIFMESIEE